MSDNTIQHGGHRNDAYRSDARHSESTPSSVEDAAKGAARLEFPETSDFELPSLEVSAPDISLLDSALINPDELMPSKGTARSEEAASEDKSNQQSVSNDDIQDTELVSTVSAVSTDGKRATDILQKSGQHTKSGQQMQSGSQMQSAQQAKNGQDVKATGANFEEAAHTDVAAFADVSDNGAIFKEYGNSSDETDKGAADRSVKTAFTDDAITDDVITEDAKHIEDNGHSVDTEDSRHSKETEDGIKNGKAVPTNPADSPVPFWGIMRSQGGNTLQYRTAVLRRFVAPAFAALAVIFMVCGVLSMTVWKANPQVDITTAGVKDAYMVSDSGLLATTDGAVTITASARATKETSAKPQVCAAIASAADAQGWLTGTSYTRITDYNSWDEFQTEHVDKSGKVASGEVAFEKSPMWRQIKCSDGSVTLTWQKQSGDEVLLVHTAQNATKSPTKATSKTDSTIDATTVVHMQWTRAQVPHFAVPYFVTSLFAVVATLLCFFVFVKWPKPYVPRASRHGHNRTAGGHRHVRVHVEGAAPLAQDSTSLDATETTVLKPTIAPLKENSSAEGDVTLQGSIALHQNHQNTQIPNQETDDINISDSQDSANADADADTDADVDKSISLKSTLQSSSVNSDHTDTITHEKTTFAQHSHTKAKLGDTGNSAVGQSGTATNSTSEEDVPTVSISFVDLQEYFARFSSEQNAANKVGKAQLGEAQLGVDRAPNGDAPSGQQIKDSDESVDDPSSFSSSFASSFTDKEGATNTQPNAEKGAKHE